VIELQYNQLAKDVQRICKETTDLMYSSRDSLVEEHAVKLEEFLHNLENDVKLTISFVGQYNAGKSTMIAGLTNASYCGRSYENHDGNEKLVETYQVGEKRIQIGAQIMTDRPTRYEYKDAIIIDTPGVHAGRSNHDQLTLDQISQSDLLVFAVPNELFNEPGGKLFQSLVQDKQRIGQVVLAVNKMSRESGSVENLKDSIQRVIEPYQLSDFYTCFIDAASYLESLQEDDPEEKVYLMGISNFFSLVESISALVLNNQFTSRLLTPLHRTNDLLDQCLVSVGADDPLSKDLAELLYRKGNILRQSLTGLRDANKSQLDSLKSEIILLGNGIADKLDGNHRQEVIEIEINKCEVEIERLISQCMQNIEETIQNKIKEIESSLGELKESTLGQHVMNRLMQLELDTPGISRGIPGEDQNSPVLELLKKDGPNMIKQFGNFAANVPKETVYKTVKLFGGKFKPWGATKATKLVNKLGGVLIGVSAVLVVIFAVAEDEKEKKYERQLRSARVDMREEFRRIACEIVGEFGKNLKEVEKLFIDDLDDVNQKQDELRSNKNAKAEIVQNLQSQYKKINRLILDISRV
jgi:hypothetical protein